MTRDELIEKAARAMNVEPFGGPSWADMDDEQRDCLRAMATDALTAAGLLADPEQHAELERARVLLSFAAGNGSQPYYPGTPAFVAWQKTEAERDALQEQLTFDSKRVYDAQVRAEKLSDTIDRVRTALVDFGQLDKSNQTTALEVLEKIDEIIDGEDESEDE